MNDKPSTTGERKAVAFCWQSKAALRLIREQVPDYGSALAVYQSLSVVASDKVRNEFQTTHQWLAQLSGFTEKTVRVKLRELERIGLITIHTPALKAPCTYKLLSFGNERRTLGNDSRTLGSGEASPLPTSEEQKNRRKEGKPLGTADRIALEGKIKLQKERVESLRSRCGDRLEVQENPGLIEQRKQAEALLTDLENRLLEA